jgi:hypothetical protein
MSEVQLPWRKPRQPGRKHNLVPVLVGILALQACFYLGLRTAPWYLAGRWMPSPPESAPARITRWRQARYEAARDPQPGAALPVRALAAVAGGPVQVAGPSGKQTILVFMPEFGCSARGLLSSWSTMCREFPNVRLIGVTARTDAELKEACEASLKGVRVAIDDQRRLETELNAAWKPRAYLFDAKGRLRYAQPVSTMDPTAVLEVRDRLRTP